MRKPHWWSGQWQQIGKGRSLTRTAPNFIRWSYVYTDEEIASGLLSASLEYEKEGWLRIQIGKLDQYLTLSSAPTIRGAAMVFRVSKDGRTMLGGLDVTGRA
jgi:hypothetical protein